MPHSLEIAVPHSNAVLLRQVHSAIAIPHINRAVRTVGQTGNTNPEGSYARRWIVGFNLVVELVCAGGIRGKDYVIAVWVLHLPTVCQRCQEWERTGNRDGEIGLVAVGNLLVIDRYLPEERETAGRNLNRAGRRRIAG